MVSNPSISTIPYVNGLQLWLARVATMATMVAGIAGQSRLVHDPPSRAKSFVRAVGDT